MGNLWNKVRVLRHCVCLGIVVEGKLLGLLELLSWWLYSVFLIGHHYLAEKNRVIQLQLFMFFLEL
jgi:hypothetical protein